ncbi:hypothetical protein DM02DRAFT_631825 [Periconia macrospinosa]|uniref:Uncharacterized protein n=1 Tax=Periconia macrospinosa TaxID=97972 RepID=A0A2V1DF02_9PLEO|nr:hypothetical protein DM02DRAFT_631825 [Periconia macrospinosa]
MNSDNSNQNFQQVNQRSASQMSATPAPIYGQFQNSQTPYDDYAPPVASAPQYWDTNNQFVNQYASPAAPLDTMQVWGQQITSPYYNYGPSPQFQYMPYPQGMQPLQPPFTPQDSQDFAYTPFQQSAQPVEFASQPEPNVIPDNIDEIWDELLQDPMWSMEMNNVNFDGSNMPAQPAEFVSQAEPNFIPDIDELWDELLQNPVCSMDVSNVNVDWNGMPESTGASSLCGPNFQSTYQQPTPQSIAFESPQPPETYDSPSGYANQTPYTLPGESTSVDQYGLPPTPQSVYNSQFPLPTSWDNPAVSLYQPSPVHPSASQTPPVVKLASPIVQTQPQVPTPQDQTSSDPEVQFISEQKASDAVSSTRAPLAPRDPNKPIKRVQLSEEELAREEAWKDEKARKELKKATKLGAIHSKTGGFVNKTKWWATLPPSKDLDKPYFSTNLEDNRHEVHKHMYKCNHQGPADSQIKKCIKMKCEHPCCKKGVGRDACLVWLHSLERRYKLHHPDYEYVWGPQGSRTLAHAQRLREARQAKAQEAKAQKAKAQATSSGKGEAEGDDPLGEEIWDALHGEAEGDDPVEEEIWDALHGDDANEDSQSASNLETAEAGLLEEGGVKISADTSPQEDEDDPLFDDDEDEGGIPIEIEIVDPEACEPAAKSALAKETRPETSGNEPPTKFEPQSIAGTKRARDDLSTDDQEPASKAAKISDPEDDESDLASLFGEDGDGFDVEIEGSSKPEAPPVTSQAPQPSPATQVPAAKSSSRPLQPQSRPASGKKRALPESDDAEPPAKKQKPAATSSSRPSQPQPRLDKGKKRALQDSEDADPPAKKQKPATPTAPAPASDNTFGIDQNVENYRDASLPKGYICGHKAFHKSEKCLSGKCSGKGGHKCCIEGLERATAKKMIHNKLWSLRNPAVKANRGKGKKSRETTSAETAKESSSSSARVANLTSVPTPAASEPKKRKIKTSAETAKESSSSRAQVATSAPNPQPQPSTRQEASPTVSHTPVNALRAQAETIESVRQSAVGTEPVDVDYWDVYEKMANMQDAADEADEADDVENAQDEVEDGGLFVPEQPGIFPGVQYESSEESEEE